MSIWNKLGEAAASLGLAEKVQDGAAAVPGAPQPTNGSTSPAIPAVVRASQPPVDEGRIAKIDQQVRNRLVTAMQNDGAPLVESLSDTLDTLAEAVPDEGLRYKAALKLLTKNGHPVDAILNDFDKCLGALDESQRTFEADNAAQLDAKVGSKQRAVVEYDTKIKEKEATVASIQAEIASLRTKRDEEQSSISGEQQNIALVESRFKINHQNIREAIVSQRTKVTNYRAGL